MASNRKLLVLPGDGIGPEVVSQVLRVVDWLVKKRSVSFDLQEGLVGGAAYDAHGTPLTDETLTDALAADAILFGSVGGPQYDDLPLTLSRNGVCSDCERRWIFSLISGQQWFLMRWWIHRH